MKLIALYLPQYHVIPENEKWWGKGYTEWDTLKKGKTLIKGQKQPRVPLDSNYYNLLNPDTLISQCELAKKYGIYGFCVYHYWFNGRLLLEKPMEIFLKTPSADIPIFFCWANHNWDNTDWKMDKSDKRRNLIFQDYKKDDIDEHFKYMLPFFKDERYMKENNKPIFCIYNPLRVPFRYLKKMIKRWNDLAKKEGFDGVVFTFQWSAALFSLSKKAKKLFDYEFEYLPSAVSYAKAARSKLIVRKIVRFFGNSINKLFPNLVLKLQKKDSEKKDGMKEVLYYESVWEEALKLNYKENNVIPGAFTDWDNSPRYGRNAKVILGSSPELFKKYLIKQINRAKIMEKDAIIVFAWNEWTEGGHLEPDEDNKYGYLESVYEALKETDELISKNKFERIFIK